MDAVANRKVYEVIHLVDPRTSRSAANLINQGAVHGNVLRREQPCLLHRPDGTVCWVSDVVSPIVDSSGGVSVMVIVFRDASEEVVRDRDLQHRALHDSLTGLSNRVEFQERLREAFLKSRHLNRPAAAILENCGAANADPIARQLLEALNPVAIDWEGQAYSVNASLGLALTSALMSDEKDWLECADKACYQAKKSGRGQLISV